VYSEAFLVAPGLAAQWTFLEEKIIAGVCKARILATSNSDMLDSG